MVFFVYVKALAHIGKRIVNLSIHFIYISTMFKMPWNIVYNCRI